MTLLGREALLDESEATLRQVRGVLSDLAGSGEARDEITHMPPERSLQPKGRNELLALLVATHAELTEVVARLRRSRSLLTAPAGELPDLDHALSDVEQRLVGLSEVLERGVLRRPDEDDPAVGG